MLPAWSVAVPLTATASKSSATGLENSMAMIPDAVFVRLPVIDRVAVLSPEETPGEIVPLLIRVLPMPTLMVPAPDNVPLLVKPPVFCNVAAEATLMAPACVSDPVKLSVPLLTLTTPMAWLLKVGVTPALDGAVFRILRNSPALLKVPVPPMPAPVVLESLRMNTAPARLLKMPLTVSGEQHPGMVLVTVPLLSHVRLAPSTPAATFTVEPAAVVKVVADVPSSVEFPVQVNVPPFGMVMLLALVRVPPDSVKLFKVTGEFARLVVPALLVSVFSAVKAVPSLNVRIASLLMLVRLAKAVPSPELIPLKSSVPQPPALMRVVPTLLTAPVKLTVVVGLQQTKLVWVEPLTL